MPLPRSPNKRAALKTLAPFPFIIAARGAFRPHTRPHLPSHHTQKGFRNPAPDFNEASKWDFAVWIVKKLGRMFSRAERANIPRIANDGALLRASDRRHDTVTWIGHTTVLVQMDGKNILTDPVWAEKAGPLNLVGAPRISEPGLQIDELPPIDCVIISHNHYDHLDSDTIRHLGRNPHTEFIVPLGVASWMRSRGIANVHELDWWGHLRLYGLTLTCTPAQHFSGRRLGDRNRSLWASWSVEGKTKKFFFGGDSGYSPLFEEIGQRLGPFDLALMPIGAYDPRRLMRPVHMDPAEAVQASLDVRARAMLGTHWGTFLLTDEKPDDPRKQMEEAVRSRSLPHELYSTFMLGETRQW